MSQVQAQPRPSVANGVGRRRTDKDGGSRPDAGFRSDNQNWRQPARTSSISSSQGGERTVQEQRLLFIHTCLIGQLVEVQTKNGLVYSGIFHAINNDNKEFGVVLKMARLIRDGAVKGGKSEAVKDAQRKPPSKSVLIHGKDFVQIIAKDVLLSGDTLPNGRARENRAEIVTDAVLSQVPHRELERELMPWKPDDDASENLSLNFSHTWRSWDQFETNKALFGVESTFNEELYTTKLERGPQMREREREALRIAREIEGQTTRNIHLAEERGMRLTSEVEAMDEESRYSSVLRAEKDVGEDDEDGHIDDHNDETFGGVSFAPLTASTSDSNTSTPAAGEYCFLSVVGYIATLAKQLEQGVGLTSSLACCDVCTMVLMVCIFSLGETDNKGSRPSSADSSQVGSDDIERVRDLLLNFDPDVKSSLAPPTPMLSTAVSAPSPSSVPLPSGLSAPVKQLSGSSDSSGPPSASGPLVAPSSVPPPISFSAQLPSSAVVPPGQLVLSPTLSRSSSSASVASNGGAAASKKSSLNPNAKEFKLNPNAKAFTPSFSSPRPASPMMQSPIYMHASLPPATSLQGVPLQYMQQQPIRYPSQAPPMQPAFLHPNGQLYPPTQMMLAHPGQLMYIQHYPQGMIQGQPVPPPPPQGPLPPPQPSQQNQQQKHRSAGIQGMHFSGAPGSILPGQQHQHQQPQMHFHNTLPGGLAPGSMNSGAQPPQGGIPNSTGPTGQNGASSGGVRAGGKGAAGGFQQQ
ncbi:unnamed protein product [Sphagnum jensenii]|uniref:Sm domain-containing protein n=1 Tax=Sphagnum jensenii TaxID=128206 RepID=A0ABP0XAF9_9BRYO